MAGTYDQLAILQDHAYRAFQITDTTFRMIINAETGNTLVIQSRPTPGNFFQDVYYGNDANKAKFASPATQSSVTNSQFKHVSQIDIKTGMVMDPYEWQSIGSQWIKISPEQQAQVWGRTAAESFMRLKIESLVASLVAFFNKGLQATSPDTVIAQVCLNESGTTANVANKMDLGKLLRARGRFGDRFGAISGAIMHSDAYFAMHDRNLSQYQNLFTYGTAFVDTTVSGLPIFVTDLPILTFVQSSVTKYRTLLLRPMAAMLYENDDYQQHFDISNGKTWIETTVQAQQTVNIKLHGGTWAATSAIHPTLGATKLTNSLVAGSTSNTGALDNPASWERVGTDEGKAVTKKELPGVMLVTQ